MGCAPEGVRYWSLDELLTSEVHQDSQEAQFYLVERQGYKNRCYASLPDKTSACEMHLLNGNHKRKPALVSLGLGIRSNCVNEIMLLFV